MKSIGIDIGSHSIKIAELDSTGKQATLTYFKVHPLSQDPNKDKHLEALDTLRTFFNSLPENQTYHVVTAVKQSQVAHRFLEFPFKERHNILKSLSFEMEDRVPFALDRAQFDAKVSYYSGNSTYVIASACPKHQIEATLRDCADSGFEPDILSIEGLALGNLFEDWLELPPSIENKEIPTPEDRAAQVILYIGHEKTIVLIFSKGALVAVRNIMWGGLDIGNAICAEYKLPIAEALKEAQKKAFVLISEEGATKDQLALSNALKKTISHFANRLKLVLLEVESEIDIKLSEVQFSGGGSQVKNLGPYLTQFLELPVNPLSVKTHHLNLKNASFNPTIGGTALGLAIEGLKKPRNPATNLLAGDYAKQNLKFRLYWKRWGYTWKTALVVFFIMLTYGIMKDHASESLAEKAQEGLLERAKKTLDLKKLRSSQLPAKLREFERNQNKIQKDNELREEIGTVNSALDVLNTLSAAIPPKGQTTIDVRILKINDESVQIEGYLNETYPSKKLGEILKTLAKSGKVTPYSSQLAKLSGKNTFGFNFAVERKKDSL